MTPSQSKNQTSFFNQAQAEAINKFDAIATRIESLLGSPPIDNYSTMSFAPFPLQLKGPRFGVKEHKDKKDQNVLQFSKDLLIQYPKYLEPILWREAFLLHLPSSIREVSLAADLGLYCYYRFGLRTKKQKDRFLQIWQTTSPPIDYAFYRYYPTAGFEYFDNIVNGNFLKMVKDWFKPFIRLSTPITPNTYTENLERWMFNHHRILRPIELKILRGLNECLTCSQVELAEKLRIRQPTVSQTIRRLAEKHHLRLNVFIDYSRLGLQLTAVKFTSLKMRHIETLTQLFSRIRYAFAIQEFDNQLLADFLIPTERATRFRQWLRQISSNLDLKLPEIFLISERMHARNFDMYDSSKGGWFLEIESIIDNFSKLLSEEWIEHIPPINFYKLASPNLKKRIKIRREDFIYMQRASDAYLATRHLKFYESHELKKAGYKESEHMAYRRRVKYLKKIKLISPPLGLGLLHVGLNSILNLHLETPREKTRSIFTALQLLPHISCRIFEDGTGVATLPVPSANAVQLKTSLGDLFSTLDISAIISMRPAWKSYGWTGPSTISIANFDIDNNKWIWTKDTLPTPQA
jgi:DNA-binding Lrp family transcriptional regulator